MEQDLRRQVLNILEKNSRLSPAEIAVMTGTDEQTVADLISTLEKEGIICGYHTLINWDKENDDSVTALIELKVTPQGGDGYNKIAEQIYQYPQVETLYLMSGAYDFLVLLRRCRVQPHISPLQNIRSRESTLQGKNRTEEW